jgi:hypothetical protein
MNKILPCGFGISSSQPTDVKIDDIIVDSVSAVRLIRRAFNLERRWSVFPTEASDGPSGYGIVNS